MSGLDLRELVVLLAGIGTLIAGLVTSNPATIGTGVSLLIATPAVSAVTGGTKQPVTKQEDHPA